MCSCDTTQRSRPLLRRTMAHSKFWDVLTKPSQSTCGENEKSSPLTAPSLLILKFPFKQPLTYDFSANHWTVTFHYSARNCCPSLKAPQSRGGAFVAEAAQHHRILFYPVCSRPSTARLLAAPAPPPPCSGNNVLSGPAPGISTGGMLRLLARGPPFPLSCRRTRGCLLLSLVEGNSRHSHGVEINSLALQLQTSFTSPFSLPPAADIPGRYKIGDPNASTNTPR